MRSLARAMRPNGFEELAVWRVSGTIDPAFSNACHRWRIFRFPIYFAVASLRASTRLEFDLLPFSLFPIIRQVYACFSFRRMRVSRRWKNCFAEKIDTIGQNPRRILSSFCEETVSRRSKKPLNSALRFVAIR